MVTDHFWHCSYFYGAESMIDPTWLWQEDGIFVLASYIIVFIVLLGMMIFPSIEQRALRKRILQQQRIQEGRQRRS